jgi:hypothetical protein
MSGDCDIEIEFDNMSNDCYIIWQPPVAVGSGTTGIQALRDLQKAAHFCVDSLINRKLKEVSKED